MVIPARATVLRWTLLVVLVFAVVGMHGLAMAHGDPPGSPGAHAELNGSGSAPSMAHTMPRAELPCCAEHAKLTEHTASQGHDHDLLHLCLAVLVALAGFMLAWLLRGVVRSILDRRASTPVVAGVGRGPPRVLANRDLLSAHCVLRL